jgi:hypothetical protein
MESSSPKLDDRLVFKYIFRGIYMYSLNEYILNVFENFHVHIYILFLF